MIATLNIILAFFTWLACVFAGGVVIDAIAGSAGWWTFLGFFIGTVAYVAHIVITAVAFSVSGDPLGDI